MVNNNLALFDDEELVYCTNLIVMGDGKILGEFDQKIFNVLIC